MSVPAPWQAEFWRRIRPPRTLKVTRIGRTYLVITLGIGFGALNTGNNLLYLVLGMMLAVIVLSGVVSERVLSGLRVKRLGADEAYAAEPFAFRWAISNPDNASYALELSEEDAPLEGTGRIAYVPRGEERVVRGELVAARRGPMKLTAVRVTTQFPFGLFAKTRLLFVDDELLIYPRRGFACADPLESVSGRHGDAGDPRRGDGDGDLLGLRPLRPGEDARRVHWSKSASAGELLRTEREREEQKSFVLAVDASLRGDSLDRRCEEAAAQTQRLFAKGYEVGLETATTRLRPGSGPGQHRRILRALATAGSVETISEEPGS